MTEHSQYTPGPWTIEEYGDDDAPALVIHKDSLSRVCFMATPGSHGDPAKIEADARLIAAAPDLLAALIELDKILDFGAKAGRCDCFPHPEGFNVAMETARAAIAKATGA